MDFNGIISETPIETFLPDSAGLSIRRARLQDLESENSYNEPKGCTGTIQDSGKENGNYRDYRVYIGVYLRDILGLYRDMHRDIVSPVITPIMENQMEEKLHEMETGII